MEIDKCESIKFHKAVALVKEQRIIDFLIITCLFASDSLTPLVLSVLIVLSGVVDGDTLMRIVRH